MRFGLQDTESSSDDDASSPLPPQPLSRYASPPASSHLLQLIPTPFHPLAALHAHLQPAQSHLRPHHHPPPRTNPSTRPHCASSALPRSSTRTSALANSRLPLLVLPRGAPRSSSAARTTTNLTRLEAMMTTRTLTARRRPGPSDPSTASGLEAGAGRAASPAAAPTRAKGASTFSGHLVDGLGSRSAISPASAPTPTAAQPTTAAAAAIPRASLARPTNSTCGTKRPARRAGRPPTGPSTSRSRGQSPSRRRSRPGRPRRRRPQQQRTSPRSRACCPSSRCSRRRKPPR